MHTLAASNSCHSLRILRCARHSSVSGAAKGRGEAALCVGSGYTGDMFEQDYVGLHCVALGSPLREAQLLTSRAIEIRVNMYEPSEPPIG